ncbi:hypothetical protein LAWI1_G001356 [Lachnellula willkommii]|uniref:Uncharacterized protein n=1 Tax=Lachnellula willkommii TaxID=215461 RepID=A0A559MD58_9HELO|nr:hypothetical protein LAWI1_G001356 [Lachnellula willkommii]
MTMIETAFLDPTTTANEERGRQPSIGSWLSEGHQLTPKSTTRAEHHYESSLSSLGSAGPASPYTTSILNPNLAEYFSVIFSVISELVSRRESNPLPEIDFTLHTEEDENQVSTKERGSEDTKVQTNPDSSEKTIAGVDFGTTLSGASSVYKDDKYENVFEHDAIDYMWMARNTKREHSVVKPKDFKRKAIRVVINGKECYARPDSASDQDIITKAFAEEHNIPIQREEGDKSIFKLGTGSFIQSIGRAYIPFKLFGGSESEHRWFHVFKKCPVPLIMGMGFLEKIKLYSKNKHLLVDCPSSFGSMPMLKWIGSPRGSVNLKANGKELVGCADTGSDLDFMSLRCARRLGFNFDTERKARTRVMLADESIVETMGQLTVSSVELSYFDSFEMTFHILPGLASDVIFSEAFLDQTDAFNTCVQIEDSEDSYQQRVNTLINFGPVQAWLSRKWTPDAQDTAQQEHDRVIEAENYRRNKADRTIRKMRDESRAAAAREAEEAKQNTFNTRHARCPHCIGERRRTGA